jgi:hypothetical protein
MKKNSKKNNNTRKNKRTTNKTLKRNTNKCKCNRCLKYKSVKLKKGGKSITNIDIMTYPSVLPPIKLLKDVIIYKTNSNIADSFKSSIYDVENSLAILKNELTDKSYPKKAYIKNIKVQ